jgi:hypothetical protein
LIFVWVLVISGWARMNENNTWRKISNMDNTPEDFEELDTAVLAESRKSPARTVLICPQCDSENVTY